MTQKDIINSLLKQADKDYQIAVELYASRKYNYCLFFGQLVLEKLLKALIVKKNNRLYPPIHSLTKLAEEIKLNLSEEQIADLKEITSYNIEARYDDIKLSFYKKATKEYTRKWFSKIKKYYLWLKNQF